jgi:hypothetical protein
MSIVISPAHSYCWIINFRIYRLACRCASVVYTRMCTCAQCLSTNGCYDNADVMLTLESTLVVCLNFKQTTQSQSSRLLTCLRACRACRHARIEALRVFLEKELGPTTFLKVRSLYSIVSVARFSGMPTCLSLHVKALESSAIIDHSCIPNTRSCTPSKLL